MILSDSETIASLRDQIQIEAENQQIIVVLHQDRKHDWQLRLRLLRQFDGLTFLGII